ncbi:creatininase family protein [Amorphus orientalis]|uniref:Creatinine amidohydrolase n=1 Tax=Amorphus orientalis TaxID=649198 RepID=A0AAE3VMG8_9HYPH|nr:creatininase family protein [Amorphus orientalis]MDQ0314391.1 creatinine amidohydrolase [Amorphus orientalis]
MTASSIAARTDPALGAPILADTIAEMTYGDVSAAAARGAVILWAFGVVEQHGPHLPTGTDIYIPSARLRLARRFLAEAGIEALILPPYYWGVNHVSASFPASIKVRPEVMAALMGDVIDSLGGDGFSKVFLVSGHGDALHNRTLFEAAEAASKPDGVQAAFVADPALFARIGVDPASPHALATTAEPEPTHDGTVYADVHAGDWETSLMLALEPDLVRKDDLGGLPPTDLSADDLAEWRKGHDHARRVTPDGYLGDPASATAEKGAASIVRDARSIAEAIAARMAGKR